MTTPTLLLGVTVFLACLALPSGMALRVMAPLTGLLAATFTFALAPLAPRLAVVAATLQAGVVALYMAGLLKDALGVGIARSPVLKGTTIGASGLLLLVVLHNLASPGFALGGRDQLLLDMVNPWGIALVAVTVLYWLRTAPLLTQRGTLPSGFVIMVFGASMLLFVMELLVVGGVLIGNTEKAALGTGGKGLANLSTNDTASFGLALLVCNFRLFSERRRRSLLVPVVAAMANLGGIVITESRTALVGAGILVVSHLALGGRRWRRIMLAGSPLLVVFGLAAYRVVKARTTAELENEGGLGAGLLALPGSGRAVIWLSFLDAFSERAAHQPLRWVVGVGPAALSSLYDDTPLESLSMVTDKVSFLPVHSDVLNVFMTLGALGLACWLLMVLGLLRSPPEPALRAVAYGGVLIFAFTSFADMLIFLPVATALLMAAVASTLTSGEEAFTQRPRAGEER